MKCEIIIDASCEEKIVVYAREESDLIKELQHFIQQRHTELLGYLNGEIVKLDPLDIHYVVVQAGKVYAVCQTKRYLLKERLYSIEEKLPAPFVKIHQSCLANLKQVERFDTSVSGTLKIRFKNGDTDYVSRRQLKSVKERIGI